MLNKILMKLGLKEKDLATYLECNHDNIEKIISDNEYTVTVVEDLIYYTIIGWKNGKNTHLCAEIYQKSTEKATLAEIDKYANAILNVMKENEAK